MAEDRKWLDELEIENAQIKWGFSRFDGRKDLYNDEGNHNFVIMFNEDQARQLIEDGWNVKEKMPLEEGDPSEWHLKVYISHQFTPPLIYFIKSGRKFSLHHPSELKQIRRDTCEQIDVILRPSYWSRPDGRQGYTAYVKEMYVQIKESRFAARYADYEEVHPSADQRPPDDEGAPF